MNRIGTLVLAAVFIWGCDQDTSWPVQDAVLDVDGTADPVHDPTADPVDDPVPDSMPDPTPDPTEDPPPDGTGTYDGTPGEFTQSFGGRSYRMYVPSAYSHSTPIPVVIGFHGAGDSGGNFYAVSSSVGWRTAADSGPFILIVPDTKSPYSDWAVWSGDPMDDFDEMNAEMGEVMDLVDDVAIHYNVDHDNVYAYGFSDGGLFLAIAGMMYAADYAGLVIAGYGWGAFYGSEPSWLIPVYMICGQSDSFYSYAEQSQGFLASQGHPLEWVPVPGCGHSFSGLMSYRSPSTIYGWLSSH